LKTLLGAKKKRKLRKKKKTCLFAVLGPFKGASLPIGKQRFLRKVLSSSPKALYWGGGRGRAVLRRRSHARKWEKKRREKPRQKKRRERFKTPGKKEDFCDTEEILARQKGAGGKEGLKNQGRRRRGIGPSQGTYFLSPRNIESQEGERKESRISAPGFSGTS